MRYRLRTLLIVLALGPPVLAAIVWIAATLRPAEDDLLKHYGPGATAVDVVELSRFRDPESENGAEG